MDSRQALVAYHSTELESSFNSRHLSFGEVSQMEVDDRVLSTIRTRICPYLQVPSSVDCRSGAYEVMS
jgi:hypothetical protein